MINLVIVDPEEVKSISKDILDNATVVLERSGENFKVLKNRVGDKGMIMTLDLVCSLYLVDWEK